MKTTITALIIAAGALLSGSADATPMRWTETGSIDTKSQNFWDSSVTSGTPFTITIDFDSTAIDQDIGTGRGFYDAVTSASLSLGNYTFSLSSPVTANDVIIYDNYLFGPDLRDAYSYLMYDSASPQKGLHNIAMQGFLISSNLQLLSSDALAIQQFPVSAFDGQKNCSFQADDSSNAYVFANGTVMNYTVTTVPEPSTAMFGVVGVFGLWVRRIRKSNRA